MGFGRYADAVPARPHATRHAGPSARALEADPLLHRRGRALRPADRPAGAEQPQQGAGVRRDLRELMTLYDALPRLPGDRVPGGTAGEVAAHRGRVASAHPARDQRHQPLLRQLAHRFIRAQRGQPPYGVGLAEGIGDRCRVTLVNGAVGVARRRRGERRGVRLSAAAPCSRPGSPRTRSWPRLLHVPPGSGALTSASALRQACFPPGGEHLHDRPVGEPERVVGVVDRGVEPRRELGHHRRRGVVEELVGLVEVGLAGLPVRTDQTRSRRARTAGHG